MLRILHFECAAATEARGLPLSNLPAFWKVGHFIGSGSRDCNTAFGSIAAKISSTFQI